MSYRPYLSISLMGILLTVAGCSTTSVSDLQQRAPRSIYKTGKPANVIARCLIENLGRLGAPNNYMRDDGATVVHFTLENDTTATFVISPGQVEVRTLSKIIPFRRKTEACL